MTEETELERAIGAVGVGMPAMILLNHFGSVVWDAFGEPPFLVGSAARGKKWRDVDVRLILSDDDYLRWVGPRLHMNDRLEAFNLAFAVLGKHLTGLPIDFQIQQQTDANTKYHGVRHPLGLEQKREIASVPDTRD